MKTHLDEHQISDAVAGLELEPAAEEHLGACLSCRQKVASLADLIEARRQELDSQSPDWGRQRQEIMLQLPLASTNELRRRRPWSRPLLAVAAILVAVIGLRALLTPAPSVDPGAVSELPVEQILADVDAMLADDSIPGFEVINQGMDDAIFENGAS